MAETRDPAMELVLKSLDDIATPTPVSWVPLTWGWSLLAIIFLVVNAMLCWHWLKKRTANRYRRDALAILAQLESDGNPETINREVPKLVKRVALAAWPRDTVASQSGDAWVAFLRNSLPDRTLGEDLARMLDDLEYRAAKVSGTSSDTKRLLASARHWIEKHHVPA